VLDARNLTKYYAALGAVFVVVAALVAVLSQLRRRNLQPPSGLTYEEEDPDAPFGGFKSSEGLAAGSPATHHSRLRVPRDDQ
jgi:hypothetical protein